MPEVCAAGKNAVHRIYVPLEASAIHDHGGFSGLQHPKPSAIKDAEEAEA